MPITRITVLRPNGEQETQEADLPEQPGYEVLRTIVEPLINGAHLEHVTVLHDGERRDLFVDEDFLEKALPRNEAATAIYRNNALTHAARQGIHMDPERLPFIAGTAVLFDRRVWF